MSKTPHIDVASARRQQRARTAASSQFANRSGELPKSIGGLVLNIVRPRLPHVWQYGWRWNAVRSLWLIGGGSLCLYLGILMFGQTTEELDQKAAKYSFVRDDAGNVVDLAYTPLVDAAVRARARTARLRREADEGA